MANQDRWRDRERFRTDNDFDADYGREPRGRDRFDEDRDRYGRGRDWDAPGGDVDRGDLYGADTGYRGERSRPLGAGEPQGGSYARPGRTFRGERDWKGSDWPDVSGGPAGRLDRLGPVPDAPLAYRPRPTSYDPGAARRPDPYDARSEDRGFFERAADEVSSWFGDEDAERRRRRDHRGRGPKGYVRSDDRIREDISDRLTEDWDVDASEIEVIVAGGEVTLSGTVDARETRRRAEDIAEAVSGVNHVQNNLRVGGANARTEPAAQTYGSYATGAHQGGQYMSEQKPGQGASGKPSGGTAAPSGGTGTDLSNAGKTKKS